MPPLWTSLQSLLKQRIFHSLLSVFSWALFQYGETFEMKYVPSPCLLCGPCDASQLHENFLVVGGVTERTRWEETPSRSALTLKGQCYWNWKPSAVQSWNQCYFTECFDSLVEEESGEGKIQEDRFPAWVTSGMMDLRGRLVSRTIVHLIRKDVLSEWRAVVWSRGERGSELGVEGVSELEEWAGARPWAGWCPCPSAPPPAF